jgi:hypothetical protein
LDAETPGFRVDRFQKIRGLCEGKYKSSIAFERVPTTLRKTTGPDDDRLNWEELEQDTAEAAALDDTEPPTSKKKGTRPRSAWPSYGLDRRRVYVVTGIVAGAMGLIALLASLLALLGD